MMKVGLCFPRCCRRLWRRHIKFSCCWRHWLLLCSNHRTHARSLPPRCYGDVSEGWYWSVPSAWSCQRQYAFALPSGFSFPFLPPFLAAQEKHELTVAEYEAEVLRLKQKCNNILRRSAAPVGGGGIEGRLTRGGPPRTGRMGGNARTRVKGEVEEA